MTLTRCYLGKHGCVFLHLVWCSLVIFLTISKQSVSGVINDNEKFTFIRNTSIFIDKTFLLRKILQNDRIVITAPRKFGKTTNLQMIKLFLANHNKKGYVESLFKNTNVWRDKPFVDKHFCQYPVIYCSLKLEVQNTKTITGISNGLRQNIQKAYKEHSYLKKSSELNKAAKKHYEDYTNLKIVDFSRGLRFLSDILHSHHRKKVVILIDDYDYLLTRGIFYKDFDLNKLAHALFHIINETINENSYLERAIFFGAVPFKSSTDLLQPFKFMESKDFSPYFGFTESETEYLLDKFRLGRYKNEVSKWYGGYTHIRGTFKICNPWSVLMFLKTKKLTTHWVSATGVQMLLKYLKPHFRLHQFVRDLVKGKNITYDSITSFKIQEIMKLKQLQSTYSKVREDYDLFLQLFLESGYLTFAKFYRVSPGSITVRIPNKEIFSVFEKIAKELPAPDFSKMKSNTVFNRGRGSYRGRFRKTSYQ